MNRKTLIAGIVLIALFIACIIGSAILLLGKTQPDAVDPSPSAGLMNPDILGATENVESKEDRDKAEQEKPQRTEQDVENLDKVVLGRLSTLDFSGLSSYIMENAEHYRTDQHVQDLKVDIANTMAATETTAPILLMTYRTPEVLAAAVAYMPMTYKLEAFLSADSLIMPAQSGNIKLEEAANISEDDCAAMLERINENSTSLTRCSEVAVYNMTLNGLPCRLWVTKTPNGWQPYLLEQRNNYTVGVLTQLEARKIQLTLYRSGSNLDQAIFIQPFDEAAYLADMAAHPENYNEDGSRKDMSDEPTADATMPDDLEPQEEQPELNAPAVLLY